MSEATFVKFSNNSQSGRLELLEKARTDYLTALESQKTISEANVSIAKALEALREAKLISDEDPQNCPICEYQPVPTLTQSRIAEIGSWNPIRELVEQTKEDFEEAIKGGCNTIEDLQSLRRHLVPSNLPEHSVQDIGEIANSDSFKALLAAHTDAKQKLQTFDDSMSVALAELKKVDPELSVHEILRDAFSLVPTLQRCAEAYARSYGKFQGYLNELATHDQDYKARTAGSRLHTNVTNLFSISDGKLRKIGPGKNSLFVAICSWPPARSISNLGGNRLVTGSITFGRNCAETIIQPLAGYSFRNQRAKE